ncbi:MAG TPA: hypothetical protein DEP25_02035 [Candidatus Taylorbacteria bacterium]|nr:hypothetical protein [Candidatus Taylorbacteria bacterium]
MSLPTVTMNVPSTPATHEVFSRFFPPPRFLEMPAVGLDISDDAVSAIGLARKSNAFVLERFGRRRLQSGSVSGGRINDANAVAGVLRELKDELKLDFVNASLSEENAYLFKVKIPRVSRKEIRGVLEFKLEENVPIPASEAIFDYTVITQAGHSNGDHIDVGVTVLSKAVVDAYTALLDKAGLVPLSFEIEAQAISRAVIPRGNRETHLVVNIGERKTGLFIISNEVVHFTSTVGIGGMHITEAIARHLSISSSEAERVKNDHSSFRRKENMELFLVIAEVVSVLKSELNKLTVYWSTHEGPSGELGKKITNIILCGRDAAIAGIVEYFAFSLDRPVEVGNVWTNAFSLDEHIPSLHFDESLDYAATVGLALPKGH